MKKIILLIEAILMLLILSCSSDNTVSNETELIYQELYIKGFSVFVEKRAYEIDIDLTNQAIELLERNLTEIIDLNLNPSILEQLKLTPLFVDWNTTDKGAVYHPSEQWIIENGYYEGKVKSIEISNIQNYLTWTNLNQPYMILHEFSHAYHDRVLNFNDSRITDAYNDALNKNIYTTVGYHFGNQNYGTVTAAYAITNEIEFFAELTESYFGLNDFYPFDRNDMEMYHIIGLEMIKAVWQQ